MVIFRVLLLLANLLSLAYAARSKFPVETENVCLGYGYNWAAEIRCLRELLASCVQNNNSDLVSSENEKTRGERSLPTNIQYGANNQQSIAPRRSFYNGYPSVPMESPNSYPRRLYTSYGNYRPPTTTVAPFLDHSSQNSNTSCKCNLDGMAKTLTKQFEKQIFEVKMGAQHECRTKVDEARKKAEDDLAAYQKMTDEDIRNIKKQLEMITSVKEKYNGSEYSLIKRSEDWYSAEEYCLSLGGHLASIHDPIENSVVASLVPDGITVWISLNDVQKENKFVNTDWTKSSYRSWLPGQPDNGNHNENCVEMDSSGQWSDLFCFVTRYFICKTESN